MAQRKPPTPQQIGRAEELFVAAELNRRGALATLYLTNTPRVDVVASSFDGDRTHAAVPLAEVKAGKDAWDILGVTLNVEVDGN